MIWENLQKYASSILVDPTHLHMSGGGAVGEQVTLDISIGSHNNFGLNKTRFAEQTIIRFSVFVG